MNIHDVVTLGVDAEIEPRVSKSLKSLLDNGKFDDLIAHRRIGSSYGYVSNYRRGDDRTSFEQNLESLERELSAELFNSAWKHGTPKVLEEMIKAFPKVGQVVSAPKATMTSIRKVAEALNMVLIPLEYLKSESLSNESYGVRRAVDSFWELTAPLMSNYVLCPVDHYSVEKHVGAAKELPIIAPSALSQAFMAITLSVPMFRAMRKDIDSMRNEMRNYQERLSSVEREVANLRARVDEMAQRLDEEVRERVREESRQAAAEEAARWYPSDPMLIAVPGSKTPDFSGAAVIGPCWGPDFPDIVAAAVGLKAIKGQREKLRKSLIG